MAIAAVVSAVFWNIAWCVHTFSCVRNSNIGVQCKHINCTYEIMRIYVTNECVCQAYKDFWIWARHLNFKASIYCVVCEMAYEKN